MQVMWVEIKKQTNQPFSTSLSSVLADAVLSCEFKTEKDHNPRIEWKKKGKGVTFVYFNRKFTSK